MSIKELIITEKNNLINDLKKSTTKELETELKVARLLELTLGDKLIIDTLIEVKTSIKQELANRYKQGNIK